MLIGVTSYCIWIHVWVLCIRVSTPMYRIAIYNLFLRYACGIYYYVGVSLVILGLAMVAKSINK